MGTVNMHATNQCTKNMFLYANNELKEKLRSLIYNDTQMWYT